MPSVQVFLTPTYYTLRRAMLYFSFHESQVLTHDSHLDQQSYWMRRKGCGLSGFNSGVNRGFLCNRIVTPRQIDVDFTCC